MKRVGRLHSIVMSRLVRATCYGSVPRYVARTSRAMTIEGVRQRLER